MLLERLLEMLNGPELLNSMMEIDDEEEDEEDNLYSMR
jgi:hypothetical protein